MELIWHPYRYYPYERELAALEIRALLAPASLADTRHGIRIDGVHAREKLERLVYFAGIQDGENWTPTLQSRLERVNGNVSKRQATRYSVHGLHEYKGKFNPQVVRAILNVLGITPKARVFDPFCGSGTSLVECAHIGMTAIGTDINPLAVFIANAKLAALRTPASRLRDAFATALTRWKSSAAVRTGGKERLDYLASWFEPSILDLIERLRAAIAQGDPASTPVLLAVASNLLRDYSLQDPQDLRIRRRKSPLPSTPFETAFSLAADTFIASLEEAQSILNRPIAGGEALLADSREIGPERFGASAARFDCALTSPPYATALPYIDTQRLSLVWLDLLPASEILKLEAHLVGSREIRGNKKELLAALNGNRDALPDEQAGYCRMLQAALTEGDGFRRQAVPILLYRYFSGMADAFRRVRRCMKDGAPFALIVGSNHTVLGGRRFDIDTPRHLAAIAGACGWRHEETLSLQTYHRYGYHMNNAVNAEGLVILRAQ